MFKGGGEEGHRRQGGKGFGGRKGGAFREEGGKGRKGKGKGKDHGKKGHGDPSYEHSPSCVIPQELFSHYESVFGPADEDAAVRNLMINYIPNKITLEDLRMVFSVYGPVEHLRIICDKVTHEPKGYGFVKYMYGQSAYAAMSFLNGYQLYHKRLKVSYAEHDKACSLIDHDYEMTNTWKAREAQFQNYYYEFRANQYATFAQEYLQKEPWEPGVE